MNILIRWWRYAIQSGAKLVIPLSTGWDPRPQSHNGTATHFLQPTAEELQNFVKDAIQMTCDNKNATEAQTVIVYAWNECAENGAALIPSLGNGTYFIRALSEILPMSC
jgi:hypothetical protein